MRKEKSKAEIAEELRAIEQQLIEKGIDIKQGINAILPRQYNGYFYIVRYVTPQEILDKKYPDSITHVTVTNTRFTKLETAAREIVHLCRTKGYVVYQPPTPAPKPEKEDYTKQTPEEFLNSIKL